jgi:hypothetical protein
VSPIMVWYRMEREMAMALNDSKSDKVWDERRTERISAAER